MLFDNKPGSSSNIKATHFDIAPTILESAGVPGHPRLGACYSLSSRGASRQANNKLARDTQLNPSLFDPDSSAKIIARM